MRRFTPAFITALQIPVLAPALVRLRRSAARHRFAFAVCLSVAACASALASPARAFGNMADTSINNMMLGTHIPPMNQALMRGVLENQSSPAQGSAPGSSVLPQQTNSSPLSMRRSSDSNLDAVQNELARLITDDPSYQAEALAAIRSGLIAEDFTKLLRDSGMNPDDLADGLTVWLMVMWLIANDQLGGPSDPARVQAVSNQLGPLFRSMPELQSLTPEQRAVEFERISVMSMFGIAAYMRLSEEGNHEALAELRAAVVEGMRQNGWDLQALTITQSGFEMRR